MTAITIVYDGACPACANYVRLLRIRDDASVRIRLVDARTIRGSDRSLIPPGADLNNGFVLWLDETYYYGADAMHVLALISTRSGRFNRAVHAIFRDRTRARLVYPLLKAARLLLLAMLGRAQIRHDAL